MIIFNLIQIHFDEFLLILFECVLENKQITLNNKIKMSFFTNVKYPLVVSFKTLFF